MSYVRTLAIVVLALAASPMAHATKQVVVVDCSKGASLAKAVMSADEHTTLSVFGKCTGAVTITTNGLTLDGNGSAVVTAPNANVIAVNGAQRVAINHITVTGGANGVVVENNGRVSLLGTSISGNAVDGMVVEANSSAALNGEVTVTNNAVFGIDVESSSALLLTGANSVGGNGVFGIQVNNGSSILLTDATLKLQNNALGMQLGTNASGFLDTTSTINASNNFSDGITIVSGSHVVNFGGTINSSNNAIHGVSINSKGGFDMDAGSQLVVQNNGQDGVHMERDSAMTVFNNPNFSGINGTSTIHASGNQGAGANLQTNSGILVSNYAAIQSISNAQAGVSEDDGSSLSFAQTIQINGVQTVITGNGVDLFLTFASRLTLLSNDIYETAGCDATVLTRGPNAPHCPIAPRM
jgi:hypothetical protein